MEPSTPPSGLYWGAALRPEKATPSISQRSAMRTYLPAYAAEHLISASEIALAETSGQSTTPVDPPKPTSLAEQLAMPLTLVFDQMAFGGVVQLAEGGVDVDRRRLGVGVPEHGLHRL